MRKGSSKKFCIRFHSSYLILLLSFVLVGDILSLIAFTSLILFHEMGHYLIARILNVSVLEIVIYPFGGICKLKTLVNMDICRELLIACGGVIFQFIFFIFIYLLYHYSFIREYTFHLYLLYNNRMIFFNLMPIYPLDGGRIVNLIFSLFFPYKVSNYLSIIISFVVIFFIIILKVYYINFSNIMIYLILLYYLIKFCFRVHYLYHRFLLERYLYSIDFDSIKMIRNYKYMYKNKMHYIFDGSKYVKESVFLNRFFSHK